MYFFIGRAIIHDIWRCTTSRIGKDWWKIISEFWNYWVFYLSGMHWFRLIWFYLIFLQALTFQKINRVITSIDSQPTFDGGVLISVLGRLQVNWIFKKNYLKFFHNFSIVSQKHIMTTDWWYMISHFCFTILPYFFRWCQHNSFMGI